MNKLDFIEQYENAAREFEALNMFKDLLTEKGQKRLKELDDYLSENAENYLCNL